MSLFTIDRFWRKRFPTYSDSTIEPIQGWSAVKEKNRVFKEAPLNLSSELGSNADPWHSKVILVSAPGAVGKSTLAKQIAFETGGIYVDLAASDPVGGNSVTGGLVKSNLYDDWTNEKLGLFIDGLDEARLRVTQEAYEAFIADIAQLAKRRTTAIVLFGRTGAIQDTWLYLQEHQASTVVFEIGYYDQEASIEFAFSRVELANPDSPFRDAERKAVEILLDRIREQTEIDGDRFAGYAPVLQAVADRVAKESNPAALIAQIERGAQPITIRAVTNAILDRERGKLNKLKFEDSNLVSKLYLPEEQLGWLVQRLYGSIEPELPAMSAADMQTYRAALDTWISEHPFLVNGIKASSAVFDALILTKALGTPAVSTLAINRELSRGAAINPFISQFYFPDRIVPDLVVPLEHIGIVYASLRARLSLGDTAALSLDAGDESSDEDEEALLKAEVEIQLSRKNSEAFQLIHFSTDQTGLLYLGSYIEDVDIQAPLAKVELGSGTEVVLVAPINIQCHSLSFKCEKLVAECPPDLLDASINIESERVPDSQISTVPIIRGAVSLSVVWPQSQSHPWTKFSNKPTEVDDPRLNEALRRFRKFIISFRSHSKGALARYRHKIEHARMTKGPGQVVLNHLIREQILRLDGKMYFLDPVKLGARAGTTYRECMKSQFNKNVVEFVRQAFIE